jgi:hypothetical protein
MRLTQNGYIKQKTALEKPFQFFLVVEIEMRAW